MATTITLPTTPPKKFPPMWGFGAQWNTDVFTSAGQLGAVTPPSKQPRLADAVMELQPGHSRVFVSDKVRPETEEGRKAPAFQALVSTLGLAQQAGANVNLTYWHGPYAAKKVLAALRWPNATIRDWPHPGRRKWPPELTDPNHAHALTTPKLLMTRFARTIQEARRQFDCVTHVTIQNEVNGGNKTDIAKKEDPRLSMRFYELLYRHLDEEMRKLPDPQRPGHMLREGTPAQGIQIVAGDLVENPNALRNNEDEWIRYMHANMERRREGFDSVLDAYSIHVYWEPDAPPPLAGFPHYPETRLQHVQDLLTALGSTKPLYVTEYGVRHTAAKPRPGSFNGHKLEQSQAAAFQHGWFNAIAPQHGVVGLTKWALYAIDANSWGEWGMVDAPVRKCERFATFRVMRLFSHLVSRGWTAAGLAHDPTRSIIASKFTGPNDHESIAVLNDTSRAQEVELVNLKKQRRYSAADWNRHQQDQLLPLKPITTTTGRATITVPSQGIVALSTRPLRL